MWNYIFLSNHLVPNIALSYMEKPANIVRLLFYLSTRYPQRQGCPNDNLPLSVFTSVKDALYISAKPMWWRRRRKRLHCSRPHPTSFKKAGGIRGRRAAPPLSPLSCTSPTHTNERGRRTDKSRSAKQTPPYTRPRFPHLLVQISVLTA